MLCLGAHVAESGFNELGEGDACKYAGMCRNHGPAHAGVLAGINSSLLIVKQLLVSDVIDLPLLQFCYKCHGSSHSHTRLRIVPKISRGNDVRSTSNGGSDLHRVFKILHRQLASGVKTFARGRGNINKSYQVVEVISGLVGAPDWRDQIIEI